MHPDEKAEVVTTRVEGASSEFDIQNTRAADSKRRAEFRSAIEASTARILSIALTRGPADPDPEAA
jgi:hypothetical protein